MRIAHLSDFHFTTLSWNPLRLFSKRILGNLNWVFMRGKEFSMQPLQELPSLFRSLQVDWILFSGDFTTTSLISEFEIASDFTKRFQEPWIAIPGNHDKYTYTSDRKKYFYRYFAQEKTVRQPLDFFTLKEQGIEAEAIGQNWWVVALDTCLATNPYSSEGLFSEKLENYLDEVLNLIPKEASILILNHYPFFQNDEPRHSLRRGDVLQKKIERDPRIRLYLHGHTHRHTIANLQPSRLPIVMDSGSSAAVKNATWNLIDLSEEQCSVDVYRWSGEWKKERTDKIDWK